MIPLHSQHRPPPPPRPPGVCSPIKATPLEVETALVSALSELLWRAGGDKAVLCTTREESVFANTQRYIGDRLTEHVSAQLSIIAMRDSQ